MFFLCRSLERKVFSMLIILIDRWQVLSWRIPLLNQANQAIWQKPWSTRLFTVFAWILEVNASKEEKRACPFSSSTPRWKKTAKSFCREWTSKLAESDKQDKGSYYIRGAGLLQSSKMAQRWQSSWKTIESTAESSFTSFLESGASFLGCEGAKRATKSREVPRHIKTGRRTVLKVYWGSTIGVLKSRFPAFFSSQSRHPALFYARIPIPSHFFTRFLAWLLK